MRRGVRVYLVSIDILQTCAVVYTFLIVLIVSVGVIPVPAVEGMRGQKRLGRAQVLVRQPARRRGRVHGGGWSGWRAVAADGRRREAASVAWTRKDQQAATTQVRPRVLHHCCRVQRG